MRWWSAAEMRALLVAGSYSNALFCGPESEQVWIPTPPGANACGDVKGPIADKNLFGDAKIGESTTRAMPGRVEANALGVPGDSTRESEQSSPQFW